MKHARLPEGLRPKPSSHLVRLGRANNGGYIVDRRDVGRADGLVSLGLFDDWSFEKAFVTGRDIPLDGYDATLNMAFLIRRLGWKMLNPHKISKVITGITNPLTYRSFFSGKRRHFQNYVGRSAEPPFIPPEQVFANADAAGMTCPFLKIDIEGSEYDLLDLLVARAGQTAGLAIEFHQCGSRIDEICRFVADYPLTLVHIHASNYSPVAASGVPETLELTFSSHPSDNVDLVLPHPLDMPNHRASPEIALEF